MCKDITLRTLRTLRTLQTFYLKQKKSGANCYSRFLVSKIRLLDFNQAVAFFLTGRELRQRDGQDSVFHFRFDFFFVHILW